jgi:hypothetical protein
MNLRQFVHTAVAALLLLPAVASVHAQAFGSISSALPAASAAPAETRDVAVATAPAETRDVAVAAATAPVAQAFDSVSSLDAAAATATGAGPSLPAAPTGSSEAFAMADRIVIEKGERRLTLLASGQPIAEYPIRLGLNPNGRKEREGDFRTPEGLYILSRRNPRSDFFLSVEVSYPNVADLARARRAGVKPGGSIMIHGQPNVPRKAPDYYASNDWTDGCIAVSNSDMVDIWLRTQVGIPIEIRP